jgi:hypothetical protein
MKTWWALRVSAVFVLLAGAAFAEPPAGHVPEQPVGPGRARTVVRATVVSTDLHNLTLTIRGDQGRNEVLAVEDAARVRLKELRPGEDVMLRVQETRPGRRRAVTQIERSRGATPQATTVKTRPPTDVVGPFVDPRVGTQQDPGLNPLRDPRVIPGLTVPGQAPSPVPSPSPSS